MVESLNINRKGRIISQFCAGSYSNAPIARPINENGQWVLCFVEIFIIAQPRIKGNYPICRGNGRQSSEEAPVQCVFVA